MSAAPAVPQADEASPLSSARDAFAKARLDLSTRALERVVVIDDLLTALVAGEHVALIGAPGVAKSMLARMLAASVADAAYFEKLLTRFTEPHELFGQLDLQAFREGLSRHVSTGMLPEAQVVFLDEAFKASSAILNTLLTALNERLWHDGAVVHNIPLQTAVLASNELPPADCSALWDRCLVRHVVKPLQHEQNRMALVMRKLPATVIKPSITLAHIDILREEADRLAAAMPESVARSLCKLASELQGKHSIPVSDRRLFQAGGYLGAVAALEGADEINDDHLGRLTPVFWSRPEHIELIDKALESYAAVWRSQLKQHATAAGALRTQWKTLQDRAGAGQEGIILQEGSQILRDAKKTLSTARKHLERKEAQAPAIGTLFAELTVLIEDVRAALNGITGV